MSQKRFSHEQMKLFKEAFHLFDIDRNGYITITELKDVMEAFGQKYSEKELRNIIKKVDKNRDGRIDFSEFVLLMDNQLTQDYEQEELKAAFKVFDRDGNGLISARELKYAMTKLGQELSDQEVHEMILEADADGDGQINYREFVRMMSG